MPKKKFKPISLIDAFRIFRIRCQAERYSTETIAFYNNMLPAFFRWCEAQDILDLDAVAPHHLRSYLVESQTVYRGTDRERPASGHTVHAVARVLRAFFNFCVTDELLGQSPMAKVKMPRKPKKILDAFDAAEVKKLLKAAHDEREKAIIYFLLDTGVRASECISIVMSDVNLDDQSVRIRHGKGDKERFVYFGSKTARYLARYIIRHENSKPEQPLWFNIYTGKPLTRSGLFQLLRRIARVAGVEHFSAHVFRRTFAINSLRNGMNIYTLARLMGHSDISVLRQYLALSEQDLKTASAKYSVVDNL